MGSHNAAGGVRLRLDWIVTAQIVHQTTPAQRPSLFHTFDRHKNRLTEPQPKPQSIDSGVNRGDGQNQML
jgi:hypothetical protein